MVYILWILNMIGYVAFTIGIEHDWKKEKNVPFVMCILSGSALIGTVMQIGIMLYDETVALGENVVTFVMLYFALAFVSSVFVIIYTVKMITQKDKGYVKSIFSQGIIAITFLLYGIFMFRSILLM